MKRRISWLIGLLIAVPAIASDALFDRIEEALTFSGAEGHVRGRMSGTMEFEGYVLQQPYPGLIHTHREQLFVPRLTVFVDAQVGRNVYLFAQARADRGFDPGDANGEVRLDEYAVRYTPVNGGKFSAQIGKFATIVGNWAGRHSGWSNPFINAPVPYENLTGIWDTEAIRSSQVLLQWSHLRPGLPASVTAIEKTLRVPIVWGPSYATGAAMAGDIGRFRYAAEIKAGSLSSRPEAWHHSREQRHHPTISARVGYRPNQMWNVGFSASEGAYLRESAERSLAAGRNRGDYLQWVIAHDVSFAWRHWQVWGEIYGSRFEIPNVGDADTIAYYVEAKYKFTPQFSGALRWNEQQFSTIIHRGVRTQWGQDIWRVDFAPAYRFTPHTQLKLQYSLQHGDSGPRSTTRSLAAQLLLRF